MKILIVEDDFISGKLFEKMLAVYGDCEIAEDGKKAIEKIERSIKTNELYDLICLDIMLPGADGHEVLSYLRERELEENIISGSKIIMMTALDDFNNIKRSYREQCEDYLIKPISKEKIENSLIRLGLLENKL